MLFCAMLLGGCSAPKTEDTTAEGESTAVPQKVIALSKSNAELWLLAGGSLIGTSEDAMELAGISPETVSLGDMDHVSLEAIAGLIGFVGLIVPNCVRSLWRGNARPAVFFCAVYGALLLLLCDTLSRMVVFPYELPCGLFLSIAGAPFLILTLIRKRKRLGAD